MTATRRMTSWRYNDVFVTGILTSRWRIYSWIYDAITSEWRVYSSIYDVVTSRWRIFWIYDVMMSPWRVYFWTSSSSAPKMSSICFVLMVAMISRLPAKRGFNVTLVFNTSPGANTDLLSTIYQLSHGIYGIYGICMVYMIYSIYRICMLYIVHMLYSVYVVYMVHMVCMVYMVHIYGI